MNIYFLTYGDDAYHYSKKHLTYLAKESNYFHKIISLGPKDLDSDFKNTFKDTLSKSKGGGYWIWKHEIISSLLNKINLNDIILYCDAGSSFNNLPEARSTFEHYLEIIGDKKNTFLRFETEKQFLEKQYTSKQLFEYFNLNLNSKIANSTQLQAGVLFVKKNEESHDFFNEYRNTLDSDVKLLTDFYNKNQIKEFVENRHDQSIFSILGKIYNSYTIENETEFKNRIDQQYKYPILTVRAANHGIKDRIKLNLLKPIYGKKTNFFK